MIKAIIFDMDGVIFDTERLYLDVWTKVFKRHGYKMTKDVYTSVMGRGRKNVINAFLKHYGQDLPIDIMYEEKDYELNELINNNKIVIKDGVYEVLKYLKENKYKIALATSAKKERAIKHLSYFGILEMFDIIICGEDVINSKPNPEIFLITAQKLKVKKENCIVVEDSEAGVQAGYNAGMKVIHIPDLKELDYKSKRYTYKTLINLKDIVDFLNIDMKQIS